jgi:hypothetical protein
MKNKILEGLLLGGVAIISSIGTTEGFYAIKSHNISINRTPTARSITIERNDGLFNSTKFKHQVSEDFVEEDQVEKSRFPRISTSYWDGGENYYDKPDGKVDRILKISENKIILLARPCDYEDYKSEFDKADKELATTKLRFKKYLELIK